MNYTGRIFTEQFESFAPVAYLDRLAGVWTVGYGETGPGIGPRTARTRAQAEANLDARLDCISSVVSRLVAAPVTQDEFNALCDFAYNCGLGALQYSTLLKKLNIGDYAGAADQFLLWDHASGAVITGLLRRRIAERTEFLGDGPPQPEQSA